MAETFPVDAVPVNGWVMELPGMPSPHISKITGMNRKTGTIEVIDGGTNRAFYFSDGILKHAPINMMRTRDGTVQDKTYSEFVTKCVGTGVKIDGTLRQFRHGKPSMKIRFLGMLCNEEQIPDMDVESSDKAEHTIVAQVDFMEFLYNEEAA